MWVLRTPIQPSNLMLRRPAEQAVSKHGIMPER
jgi:hypothetical protein